jgi:hypothetical protein
MAFAFLLLAGLLPGLALAVLVRSRRPATSGVGLLVPTCGWAMTCWLVTSGVLARTSGLSDLSCGVAAGLLTGLSIGVLALPSSRRTLRRDHGGLGEAGWGASALVLAMLTWLPVGLVSWATTWGPLGSTSWYYWGLAQQTAEVGHLPATSVEFGTVVPFLSDYPLFTTGTASLLALSPPAQDALVRQTLTVVPVLAAGLGVALLVRVLGVGRIASLSAVPLVVGTGIAADKLSAYRPEGFAIGVLFLAVALVLGGVRRRDVGLLAPGVALSGVLSQVHGIALVTAGALLVAGCVATWAFDRTRATALVVSVAAVSIVACIAVLALATGGISGTAHSGGLSNVGGLSDPTWEFSRAVRAAPPTDPPDRADLLESGLRRVYQEGTWWYVAAALLSIVAMLSTRAARRRFGALAAFAVVSLGGLAAAVAVLVLGWDSYVPRRTGTLRVVGEASLLLPVVVAGGLGASSVAAARGGRRASRVLAGVGVAVALAVGVVGSVRVADKGQANRVQQEDVEALRSLDLPDDAVVLTDGYSEGVIHEVTGAVGLLEGRAPYTFPEVLVRANLLLRESAAFYDRPRANKAFLDEYGVDYVVVQLARSITGDYRFRRPDAVKRLEEGSAFVKVAETPRMLVFRYDTPDATLGRSPTSRTAQAAMVPAR